MRSRELTVAAFLAICTAGCGVSARTDDGGDARDESARNDVATADVFDAVTPDAHDAVTPDANDVTGADANNDTPGDTGDPAAALALRRAHCDFMQGDHANMTLGLTAAERAAIPIRHLLVYVGENRSFDHYLGRLPAMGRTDVDGIPAGYTNPRASGGTASPAHAGTTCISPDIPHAWTAMHQAWHAGAMDQFYNVATTSTVSGQRALAWYDQRDLPFYQWLYGTFAISDRFFSSVLGPTWPNRDFIYAATSDGVKNTFERQITVPTIFAAMTTAHVSWNVYSAGSFREDCINWTNAHAGVTTGAQLFSDLSSGNLPQVAFIDGPDDHPPADVQTAEAFARRLYLALRASPAWPTSALIMTYDEAGGFFDHVPPPAACRPDGTLANTDFNRLGIRVPLVVVSPWARSHYASHVVHESASITRLIETLHDLPALTNRDANVSALLDLFDFSHPASMAPPAPPAAGTGGCP